MAVNPEVKNERDVVGDPIWEDRQVRFDVREKHLACRKGEMVIDRLEGIEDTKGNNGCKGVLVITNLRLIWHEVDKHSPNLSIGLGCITNLSQRVAVSKLRGRADALFVLSSNQAAGQRLEFIFTNIASRAPRLFSSVRAVHKSYESSKMYREVKMRSAMIRNGTLQLLREEQTFETLGGVWNLSTDEGNLGSFTITNIRVVWHASSNPTFNISIPYIKLRYALIRDSKFGQALVLEVRPSGGGYVLGFRVDPVSKLREIQTEIKSMLQISRASPIFGVQFEEEPSARPVAVAREAVSRQATASDVSGDQDEDGSAYEVSEAFARYYAEEENTQRENTIEFNEDLQLCIQKLPEATSISDLWEVCPRRSTRRDRKPREAAK